jgi:hypothetical protein
MQASTRGACAKGLGYNLRPLKYVLVVFKHKTTQAEHTREDGLWPGKPIVLQSLGFPG